jgi:uncharacterized protein Yka (UPF0111/DUF47 family)
MPKKEDVFYTLLKRIAEEIEEASKEYVEIVRDFPDSMARIPRMKVHETTTDELVKEVHEHLYTSFITPFDREDISDLALRMDDIIDGMDTVTTRLDLYNMSDMRPEAIEMAELTVKAVYELRQVIERLPNYKRDEQLMHHAIAVSRTEDGGDRVYQNALRRLFTEEDAGKVLVTWMRIFDNMELCLNACDWAAGVVRSVVMKSA